MLMQGTLAPELQDTRWVLDRLPTVLPTGWTIVERAADGLRYFYRRPLRWPILSVIASGCTEEDGQRWIHLSCAYMDTKRLPEWDVLVRARDVVLGHDAKALQVLAPRSEHINIHRYCLHLWHCVDGDPLPDFTRGGLGL